MHQPQRGSRQMPDVPPECGGGSVALPRPRGVADEGDWGWGRCTRVLPVTVEADGHVFDRAQGSIHSEIKSIRLVVAECSLLTYLVDSVRSLCRSVCP